MSAQDRFQGAAVAEDKFQDLLTEAKESGNFSTIRTLLSTLPFIMDIERVHVLLHEWSCYLYPQVLKEEDLEWGLGAAVEVGKRDLVQLLLKYGAGATLLVTIYLLNPPDYDVETFEGILQDLLDNGWDVSAYHLLT